MNTHTHARIHTHTLIHTYIYIYTHAYMHTIQKNYTYDIQVERQRRHKKK